MSDKIDYGPLTELIGTWKGDKGVDLAPEPDGNEVNPFYETITFTPVGDVDNADSQVLHILHYRQIVQRHSNDEVFHDETGYWLWEPATGNIVQSLTIPRAVSLLAGGKASKNDDGTTTIEVSAAADNPDWNIIQSPFMRDNARTISFSHTIVVGNGKMKYSELTVLDIYGRTVNHTDNNELELL
jgi:hypothetical protein